MTMAAQRYQLRDRREGTNTHLRKIREPWQVIDTEKDGDPVIDEFKSKRAAAGTVADLNAEHRKAQQGVARAATGRRDSSYANRLKGGERVLLNRATYSGKQIHAGQMGVVLGPDTNAGFRGIEASVRFDDGHVAHGISTGVLTVLAP